MPKVPKIEKDQLIIVCRRLTQTAADFDFYLRDLRS